MSQSLLFNLLLIFTLLSGGMLGLWAATSRLNWSVRLLTVVLLLSLLMWRPLYEPYLTLLSEVGVVVLGVAIWRRSSWRWPSFSRAGILRAATISAVVTLSLSRSADPNIGLLDMLKASLLGVFAAVGVLVGSWLVVSQRQWWYKVSVLSMCSLMLFVPFRWSNYVVDIASLYFTDYVAALLKMPECTATQIACFLIQYSSIILSTAAVVSLRRKLPTLSFAVIALVAALPVVFAWQLSSPLPAPAAATRASSAYIELLELQMKPAMFGVMLEWNGDPIEWDALEAAVAEAEPIYSKMEQLVRQPLTYAVPYYGGAIEDYTDRTDVTQYWHAKLELALHTQNVEEVHRSLLWLWGYVLQLEGQGTYVEESLHRMIEEGAARATYDSLPELTRDQKLHLASVIFRHNARRSDGYDVMRRSRISSENFRGWHGHLVHLLERIAPSEGKLSFDEVRRSLRTNTEVAANLLSARLAIDAYQFDHGSPPDTLADLVPEYLPSVPLDASSSSGEPLLYRRTDDGFMVYARGRDGDDDGGKATELGGLETEGDLTLEGLFPPDPGP